MLPAVSSASGEWQVIHLHVQAPLKPGVGAPCNGCGVCCATEPCPVGIVLSGRRRGSCKALRWDPNQLRYHCGAISAPASVLPPGTRWLAPLFARLAPRWIAAGSGCDATLTAATANPDGAGD